MDVSDSDSNSYEHPEYNPEDERYNSKLYRALSKARKDRVLKLCRKFDNGPLHVVSIHDDTVLHMALYSGQTQLVLDLLNSVPPKYFNDIYHRNAKGNTILHEAAASDKMVRAAEKMLDIAPDLLPVKNEFKETALYRAVRYGRERMFKFLDAQVHKIHSENYEEISKAYYQKEDGTNILHTAVSAEQFDLALTIASRYKALVPRRDGKRRTPLQLLASNSLAFQSRQRRFLKQFMFPLVSSRWTPNTEEVELGWRVPWWEAVKKEKRKYEFALELADFLVPLDLSWKETLAVEEGEGKGNLTSTTKRIYETPLFTATKSGCIDIVERILKVYPQSVEHVDGNRRTILHVAVIYRQMEVFELVEKMEYPMRRLIKMVDKDLNSILHMVGEKVEKDLIQGTMQSPALQLRQNLLLFEMANEDVNSILNMVGKKGEKDLSQMKTRSPALQLQDNLLLFERVKKICSEDFFRHVNARGQTAEELFAQNNEPLREEAKEWLKGTAQNCTIVAVLIATVAFAAAYTVPGGSDQDTGTPILLNQTFFGIFTITDVLSLTCTLTSVVIFLSILTSSFRLKDFKQSLPQQLMLGVTFLIFSVSMMMLAFAATIILMIRNRQQWTKIALYTVAFLPVSVFAVSYMPLYFSLMETFKYSLKKIAGLFPRYVRKSRGVNETLSSSNSTINQSTGFQCFHKIFKKMKMDIPRFKGGSFRSCIENSFKFGKSQISSSPKTSQIQATDSDPPRDTQENRSLV